MRLPPASPPIPIMCNQTISIKTENLKIVTSFLFPTIPSSYLPF